MKVIRDFLCEKSDIFMQNIKGYKDSESRNAKEWFSVYKESDVFMQKIQG